MIPSLHTSFGSWKMLLSKKSFTEEEDNYLRVCLLLTNIGTPALHMKFRESFDNIKLEGMTRSATLHEIFKHYKTLIDDLKKKRQITDSNRDFLLFSDQVDNVELYDIKLMAVLLTSFASEESKNIIILKKSTKKAIEDIHKERNVIVHKITPTLSNKELNTIWNTITEAIQQLGGTSFEQELYTLRNATFDSSNTIIHQNINCILGFISEIESEYFQETDTTESHTEETHEDSISPTEKENFVRLCFLLIKIAPIAVRYCFKELLPERLDEMIMRLKGVNADIDLKCSIDHSGIKYKDNFDNCPLPEILFLLKCCLEFRILDEKLPDPSETTIDADLSRINYYTQFIGDVKTTGSLTTTAFNDIWNIVAEAISRLGDVHTKQQCECLKKANIDDRNADIMIGLVEVQKKIITLRKHKDKLTETLAELRDPLYKIIHGKTREVEEWAVEDKLFSETRSSAELLKFSRNKHIKSITVIGSFGVGKTFITRHVSLILMHEEYRILPVSTVAEIRELDDEEIPTVFIVDDFCGRGSVEQRSRDIKMWRNMPDNLIGSKSKIIVCCTLMVYQHFSFSKCLSYFRSCVINMNSSDLALNNFELHSIAKMHTDIDDKLIKKYSNEFSFFPFLCRCCSIFSINDRNKSKYLCHEAILKNANEVYTFQLNAFFQKDKAKFTALALIVQLNNLVKEGCLAKTSKDYICKLDKINIALKACKFHTTSALSDIKEELKSMIGSYIIVSTDARNNKIYSAKSLEVYQVLVAYFKKELPGYFIGSFPSHKNYSKLHSVLNYVHNRVNILTPILLSWIMVVIGIWVVLYSVFIEIKAVKPK